MGGAQRLMMAAIAYTVAVIGGVVLLPAPLPAAAQETAPAPVRASVTASAIEPSTVVLTSGQTLVIENTTNVDVQVVAADGSFDSGIITPGGAFVAAIDASASIAYGVAGDPTRTGRIVFGLRGLPGAAAANARGAIPDLAPPPTDGADFSPHPVYGYPTSRTTLLALPAADATVGQVNDALAAVGVTVVGGSPLLGNLFVAIADTGDHAALLAALTALRSSVAFRLVGGTADNPDLRSGAVSPVWEGDTEQVPEPFVPQAVGAPWVFAQSGGLTGGDWGLADVRAPAAWNALDTARTNLRGGTSIGTSIIDAGFDTAHPDLAFASRTGTEVNQHGTHVAGIIGARYDDAARGSSRGTAGVNPVARVHARDLNTRFFLATAPANGFRAVSILDFSSNFAAVLGAVGGSGTSNDVRVINASFGAAVFNPERTDEWVAAVATRTCGPGPIDDGPGLDNQGPCFPSNEDTFRADLSALAFAYGTRVLDAAMQKGVIIVKSAGNANDVFCTSAAGAAVACERNPTAKHVGLAASDTNEFVRARQQILDGNPSRFVPLLVVGAKLRNHTEIYFSQPGGDLLAPGARIRSTTIADDPSTVKDDERGGNPVQGASGEWYGEESGTSMAAPFVTGAVGYLWALKPSLTAQQVHAAVLASAAGAGGAGTPRLDVYGAALRVLGLRTFADSNDASPDGNRRIARTAAGTETVDITGAGAADGRTDLGRQRSEPDGRVDLRDVRAFRDAWLQTCVDGSAPDGTGAVPVPCPASSDIVLDGGFDHPKRDGNGDGCAGATAAACLMGEARYNRFDLNGDGVLAINTKAPVPLDAAGAVSTSTTTSFSDLELMAMALDQPTFDGWTRAEVAAGTFLRTADITLDLSRVATGTTDITVWAESGDDVRAWAVDVSAGIQSKTVVSVPVATGGSNVTVWYDGVRAGEQVQSGDVDLGTLRIGEDATAGLCDLGLRTTIPDVLVANQTVLARAAVDSCGAGTKAPTPESATFTVTAVDPASAASPPTVGTQPTTFDPAGVARTPLTAGTTPGLYRVRIEATSTSRDAVRVEKLVRVVPRIQVRYSWEAEVTDLTQTTSTDWPDTVAGRPDCREIPYAGCVVTAATSLTPGAAKPRVVRDGTITFDTNGVRLDETVDGTSGSITVAYTWQELNGPSSTGTVGYSFEPRPAQQSTADRPVGVQLGIDADGSVVMRNFRAIGDVRYRTSVANEAQTGTAPDPGIFGVPGALVPLSLATPGSVQHQGDPNGATRLRPTANGGFTPSTWCGKVRTPIVHAPGYRQPAIDPFIDGIDLGNDPVYDPDDIPLPAGAGAYGRSIRFAVTAATTGSAPAPVLPTCAGSAGPVSDFVVETGADGVIREGDAVQFLERARDPDGDITEYAWSFGDLRSSRGRDPLMVPGFESGSTTVALRVTDSTGLSNRVQRSFSVENVAPSVEVVNPYVTTPIGVAAVVQLVIDDPGPVDRKGLRVSAMGNTGRVSSYDRYPAGVVALSLNVLPPGTHQLRVIVEDDTESVEVPITVVVIDDAQPPPPPPERPRPVATCASQPVVLSGPEAELWDRWNSARTSAGLPRLELSPELTSAAATIARGSLGVLGIAAGVDVVTISDDAGYAGAFGVNALASSREQAPAGVLEALRASGSSTVFSADAQMAGVALVRDGPNTKWVIVVGQVQDCDSAPRAPGAAPTVTVTPPSSVIEGDTVSAIVQAADVDGDLAEMRVDWGDGFTGSTTHRYRDDGTFALTVRATDEQGNTAVAGPFAVSVAGAAPELAMSLPPLVAGQLAALDLSSTDRAEADRPLSLSVVSNPPAAVSFVGTIRGGRTLVVTPPASATSVDITATVTDPDGLSTTVSLTRPVTATPPLPPVPPAGVDLAPAIPPCPASAPTIGLRAQAADFLIRSNNFRASQGVSRLAADAALQKAAELQLDDMIAGRYFAHIDSSSRSPLDRAVSFGYTGGVGENLAMRVIDAEHALLAWRSSPVHLSNLLDPVWNATGVAVGNGPDGVLWVHVFGTVATCPSSAHPAKSPALVLENPAIAGTSPVSGYVTGTTSSASVGGTSRVVAAPPPLVTASPQPDTEVAGYTIDRAVPAPGQVVTITNRSRSGGIPVGADLVFGDLPARTLAPDATFRRAVYGPQEIRLTAGTTTSRFGIAGAGAYDPTVTVVSPTSGVSVAQGAVVPVVVTVTDPIGGALAGVLVKATPPGGLVASAVTDVNGRATLAVKISQAGTPQLISLRARRTDGTFDRETLLSLAVVANTPPAATAGGPYAVELNDSLRLDAPTATDTDGISSYDWDLDRDGSFDDATGQQPLISWAAVNTLVCGGACSADQTATIRLRVTDTRGASTDAETTVTAIRDFGIAVSPQEFTLPPGSRSTLRVDVVTRSGFGGPVRLSVGALPAGVTATLSATEIYPGVPSYLEVVVDSNVPSSTTTVPISVTGTATLAGAVVQRTASPLVSVVFGLQRICTVTWSGRLVDAITGAGVSGRIAVGILPEVTTAPDGSWTVAGIPLGSRNEPRMHGISGRAVGFHPNSTSDTAVCGVNRTDIAVPIYRIQEVPVRVRVTDFDAADVVPASTYLRAVFFATGNERPGGPDANGYATFMVPLAGPDNRATGVQIRVSAPSHHSQTVDRSISRNDVGTGIDLDVRLSRICFSRLTGGLVVDPDGRPVAGAAVSFDFRRATTDADGRFVMDVPIRMAAPRNGDVQIFPSATPPEDRPDLAGGGANIRVSGCESLQATLYLRFGPGALRYGTVVVNVKATDGTPIPDALVNGQPTDANGVARIERTVVGYQDPVTGAEPTPQTLGFNVTAGTVDRNFLPMQWWPRYATTTNPLASGATEVIDVVLDPVRFATVTGTIVDASTNEPMANVGGTLPFEYRAFRTGADGRFTLPGIRLNQTGPTQSLINADATATHWSNGKYFDVPAGETSLDVTLPVLRRCANASVVGTVVAEGTLAPIAGATVRGAGFGSPSTTTTADGSFSLSFGPQFQTNLPYRVTLEASAPGFNPSTRDINIFCGAQLVVDFAPPPPGYGTVTGTVRDNTGAPAADMFVGGSWGGATRTGVDGTYVLTGAPSNADGSARPWTVTAVPPSGGQLLPASAAISVAAGQSVSANLALTIRDVGPPPNRAPVARINPASPNTPEGTPVALSGATSTDEDGDRLTFAWDVDGDGFDDGGLESLTVAAPQPGARDIRLRVSDARGLSTIATISLVVTNVAPTVALGDDVTIGPNGIFNRPAINFVDPGATTPFAATVDWGDEAGPQPIALAGRFFDLAHDFGAPGMYTVTVQVCDASNACGTDSLVITVSDVPLPNLPPRARVSAPSQTQIGRAVTFDASASFDPDGLSLVYAWDTDGDGSFDDGADASVTVTPTRAGSIEVVVLVTDVDGAPATASAVVQVVVSDPPPSSPSSPELPVPPTQPPAQPSTSTTEPVVTLPFEGVERPPASTPAPVVTFPSGGLPATGSSSRSGFDLALSLCVLGLGLLLVARRKTARRRTGTIGS